MMQSNNANAKRQASGLKVKTNIKAGPGADQKDPTRQIRLN